MNFFFIYYSSSEKFLTDWIRKNIMQKSNVILKNLLINTEEDKAGNHIIDNLLAISLLTTYTNNRIVGKWLFKYLKILVLKTSFSFKELNVSYLNLLK